MVTSSESMGGRSPANLKPMYIYEAPVRIWHWVHALSIFVLAGTGYLIANPLPAVPGEASQSFLMGNIRMIRKIARWIRWMLVDSSGSMKPPERPTATQLRYHCLRRAPVVKRMKLGSVSVSPSTEPSSRSSAASWSR